MIQVNLIDIFNYVKTFAVHELAKAEDVMHGAYLGQESDIAKVAAQGAYEVMSALYDGLTTKVQEAMTGIFSFKDETASMIKNIEALDPYMLHKAQQVVENPAAAPVAPEAAATPVEGQVLPPAPAASPDL